MMLPAMALGATIYNFDVELADTDRGVYETLALRVPQHPSESDEYLVARVLAYLLEFTDGIEFSRGVSDPDAPTIAVRDLTGAITTWIEVGAPDAARLHKASKASPRVVLYTHREPRHVLQALTGERIHRAADLEMHAIDRALIDGLVARLERRNSWEMSVTERHVYVAVGGETVDGDVMRFVVP